LRSRRDIGGYRCVSNYQLNAQFLYSTRITKHTYVCVYMYMYIYIYIYMCVCVCVRVCVCVCYIIILDMFRAVPCSSSGGQIVLLQHLVSSLSVNGRTVCRLRADLFQITNLMHNSFILWQYISYIIILDIFRAVQCSSSGGQIVLL